MQNLTETETVQYSMETPEIAHLAGVFDIAGNITIEVSKDSDYAIGYQLRPDIQLQQLGENNPIVGKIMEYCDEEVIKYYIVEENSKVQFRIQKEHSVKLFLEPMMPYLVGNYIEAELMLTEILPAMADGKDKTKNGFYELIGMAEKLRRSTNQRKKPKYTQEYFAEEWSLPE